MIRTVQRKKKNGDEIIIECDDLKSSKKFLGVYYQILTVKEYPLGEEPAEVREFKMGQSIDGYIGHYEAYIYLPAHWKFSRLSREEIAEELQVYGDKLTWKNIHGPDGAHIDKLNVIGWSYGHGLPDERYISREEVNRDIQYALNDILRWQWEHDYVTMYNGLRSELEHIYYQLGTGLDMLHDCGIYGEQPVPCMLDMREHLVRYLDARMPVNE